MKSIKTLVRAAYRNRYGLRVEIKRDGRIIGHHVIPAGAVPLDPVRLGHIADCRTADAGEPGRRTGIRTYNRDFLIFTFGPNGEGVKA